MKFNIRSGGLFKLAKVAYLCERRIISGINQALFGLP